MKTGKASQSKIGNWIYDHRVEVVALIVITGVILLFFIGYTDHLFQTDTYAKWFYSWEDYHRQYMVNVRYGECLYMAFFYKVMGNPQHFRAFHVAIGLVLDIVIVFILWKILCSKTASAKNSWRQKALLLLIALLLRANVFYSDIFQYGVDSAPMFIGDLLAIAGAWVFLEKRKVWKVVGILLLCASLFFRQTCLFWFLFTAIVIIYSDGLKKKSPFELIQRLCTTIGAILVAVIPVLTCINLFAPHGSRGSFSEVSIGSSFQSLRETLGGLLKNCDGLMPNWFYTILLFLVLCFGIYLIFRKNGCGSKGRRGYDLVLWMTSTILILIGTFFTVFFEAYLPHRTTYGFAVILPFWIFFLFQILLMQEGSLKRLFSGFFAVILIADLIVGGIYTMLIYNGMIKTNQIDQDDARFYYEQILSYEEATGNTVNNIAWHMDDSFTWKLPGVIGSKNINNRAYAFDWSRREIMPYTVNRRFNIVPYPEEAYQEYFAGIDWDGVDIGQIVFDRDTAFIIIY